MKFISYLIQLFWARENRPSLFSDSLEEAFRDVFKEMGYQMENNSREELNKGVGQK